MNTEPTKGPWRIAKGGENCSPVAQVERFTVIPGRDFTLVGTGESLANAWLVCAAPQMYAALQMAEQALCQALRKDPTFLEGGGSGEAALESVVQALQAASTGVPTVDPSAGLPIVGPRPCRLRRQVRECISHLEKVLG